jgi:hypothetical protein
MFKLYRNKRVITLFIAFAASLFGANSAFASHHNAQHRLSYLTRLDHDLDGDHIPETATIRQRGYVYQVNIHFTTGRPKLRLTTYVTEGVAGLSLQTRDINNDSKDDLVITSATSIRPIAIWLNQGKSKFQKISSWAYLVGGYTGPEYRRQTCHPDPVGNVSIDPLPQTTFSANYFNPGHNCIALLYSEAQTLCLDSILRQVPPRGPPTATHI